jgi:hypothetical protein
MRSLSDIVYNFHWIVPGDSARGAQAYAGFLGPYLTARRIASLINLRGRNDDLSWWKYETATAKALGIAHFDAMLDSRRLPTRVLLTRLFEVFDAAPRPFMLKCSGGQDRTSFAAGLYIIHREGWGAMEKARAQFARWPFLHFPKKHQRWLMPFLDFAEEEAGQTPIATWISQSYDPVRLEAWLTRHGFADSHAGIFLVPTRSPRQW